MFVHKLTYRGSLIATSLRGYCSKGPCKPHIERSPEGSNYPYELKWNSHVLGWFKSERHDPSQFVENEKFTETLHQVIADHCHEDPQLRKQIQDFDEGWVHVSDLRKKKSTTRTPQPDDILGSVEYREGQLVQGSYQKNDTYRLYSLTGPPIIAEFYAGPLQDVLGKE